MENLAITWLGHSSFRVRTPGGKEVLFDPWFTGNPSFPEAPNGVMFDDPMHLQALSGRILVRAVQTRTMPLGNLTGMTDAERDTLGAWIAQGAHVDASR